MKNSTLFLLIIFIAVICVYFTRVSSNTTSLQSVKVDDSIDGSDLILTDNYANKQLKYYYYIPKKILQNKKAQVPYLVMVPGLSGDGQGFVSQTFKDFAKKEGFVIIAPTFIEDSNNWKSETSYQYPSAWSAEALNKIISTFDNELELKPKGLYLFGFSAGAQFVSRYSLLYPNFVKACVFNSAGGTDNPLKFQPTKFYVAIGSKDDDMRKKTAQNFYSLAKQLGIDVTYKEYDIGHELSEDEIRDELDFLRIVKNSYM